MAIETTPSEVARYLTAYGSLDWIDGRELHAGASSAAWLLGVRDDVVRFAELWIPPPHVLPGPRGELTLVSTYGGTPAPHTARIARRDADGHEIFTRLVDVEGSMSVGGAVRRSDGRTVVTGVAHATRIEGLDVHPRSPDQGYLLELDPCGDVLWVRTFEAIGIGDAVAPDGSVYGIAHSAGRASLEGVAFGSAGERGIALFRVLP